MNRRYPAILGALSVVLLVLAYVVLRVQAESYDRLSVYYQSSDFSAREQVEFQALQQLSNALYEITPWLILAGLVPVIVIALIAMLSAVRRDGVSGASVSLRQPLEPGPGA